jgi:dihydroneopterin aldolase
MHKVLIENAVFHAHHGVFEEETIVGGKYEVNIEIETDFSKSAKTDELSGTIDYSKVYSLIEKEMRIPSKLIEHVGQRIVDCLYANFDAIQFIKLKISKLNPPIKATIEKVSIVIEE